MISVIKKGKGFKATLQYLLHGSGNADPGRGLVLETNFAGRDAKAWSKEFSNFRKLKPNLSRAIAHISLSLSPDDRAVDDSEFSTIARKFKEGLGYGQDCPYVLVRHRDRDHQHVHLLLSRISASGEVVPETNDWRKAEKLAAALRAEYGLKGPDKKSDKENAMNQAKDMRTLAIESRLEAASVDAEAVHAATAEPEAPSVCAAGTHDQKTVRDWRREMLSEEYRKALDDLFLGQIRYVRKSTKALTVYFRDGSRLHDTGDKATVYACPDPNTAAERIIEIALLRGWDRTGIVLTGDNAFLKAAMLLALQKGVPVVASGAHQLALLAEVKASLAPRGVFSAGPLAEMARSETPTENPLALMNGAKGLCKRLEEKRTNQQDGGEDSMPPSGPSRLRRLGVR